MDVPIVQGTAVPAGGDKNPESHHDNDNEFSHLRPTVRPDMQAPGYRDAGWAVLFVCHLIAMVVVIGINMGSGAAAAANGNGGVADTDYSGIYYLVGITAVSTIALGSATLQFMMKFPVQLVQGSLVITVLLSGVIAILGLMSGQAVAAIVGGFFFAIGVCYAKAVWPRIPFAAANLNTALTAVKANMGVTIIAYGMILLAFGWSILWFIGMGDSLSSDNSAVVFLLVVSFYWVQQVLSNTVQTTVAGTIGTWWFVPNEASSYWSSAIKDSFGRATTYSFGSICLGSFIVAVVQALRATATQARQNRDAQLLVCIIDCILACIQDILEYINKWAYVYVGLYGFGYIDAGRNVLELFKSKGWDVIIADNLCDRVLFMVSLGVGVFTGLIGLLCAYMDNNLLVAFDLGENSASAGFFIGLVVGFVFCSILMNVVGGAVNTVIVCYAESPAEFQANHPELAHEMRSAYMQAFPDLSL